MIMKLASDSPSFTRKIGLILSKILKSGDVLLLTGELGAGKTTFVSGVAEGLGIKENLSSPSFTIINLYEIASEKKFIHADFYRLNSSDEILNTGIEDYLSGSRNIACMEWGDKIKDFLGPNYLEIKFEYFYPSGNDSDKAYTSGYTTGHDFNSNLEKRLISFNGPAVSGYWDRKLKVFKKLLERQRCIFLE
ncbi:MAG: tRNA (adenosine(37)-N6)-threonylcarbamoyltransferase complex ATPase subunit type 1 TsaE [Actinobacteria bacterium]|nr:tRNA (adenosine(37)-N6)-threonylcarbamoyltransferase complex ATPase subunit type 1 TsaE [Actinomycetota bacterium]MCL5070122.1 tRNA (adenosine(37)-N6)-threonylcarbamoyltransferase complex ATPase subunit type 1 TsaE [Actinomycetota bacterium]